MASVVMALDGSSRRVVGMHPSSRQSIEQGFLRKVYPEALAIRADVTRGGMFTPNIESILELRPDVVIQWTEPADLIAALERARIKVVGLINDPPTQEVHQRNLTIVGAVIGRSERVDELLAGQKRVRAEIDAALGSLPPSERPRMLYLRSLRPALMPAGKTTYQDFWMGIAGRNVAEFAGMNTAINAEQIIAWNPQMIFLGAFDDSTPADILAIPALRGVDAVRDRRIYKLPHGGYRWDPGSHESQLTWQWVSMLAHPGRVRFDLRGNIRTHYR